MPAQAGTDPEKVSFTSLDGVELTAWLFRPAGATPQPLSAVVAMHGCGGLYASPGAQLGTLSPRHQAMADRLVAQGYAVLFPDSLTPRGMREICTQKNSVRSIKQQERRRDALAALKWLSTQPWADARRIALLGWSNGGSAVLSATDAQNREVQDVSQRFTTAIAFYPGCAVALRDGYRPNTGLTLLVGELDDWTAPGPCVELARVTDSTVVVYPGAYHGFDGPTGRVVRRTDVPNGANPGQGVHVGPHPESREKANALVTTVLQQAFSAQASSAQPNSVQPTPVQR